MRPSGFLKLLFVYSCLLTSLHAAEQSAPIADPRKWSEELFESRFADSSLVEFALDLDQDGVPELFLGAKASIGNAGGNFIVFKKTQRGYIKIGENGVHPKAIRTRHPANGKWRFATYWRSSAFEGSVEVFSFDGREIHLESSKVVDSSDPMVAYICRN